jgi:hypothetical protein
MFLVTLGNLHDALEGIYHNPWNCLVLPFLIVIPDLVYVNIPPANLGDYFYLGTPGATFEGCFW